MNRLFAAIDADSSDIAAVAARWDRNGGYRVEGYCRIPAGGFGKGSVSDLKSAVESVRAVMDKLADKTARPVHDVYSGVSSTSLAVVSASSDMLLSRYGREITEKDINRCVDMAATIRVPLDREILHTVVRGFSVDGEKGIDNPLNLEGVKLRADVNVITINSSAVRNMEKCITQAGFNPAGFVSSPLASSFRVLGEEDRKKEVVLIDMGRNLTEAVVFRRGSIRGCGVLPLGTANIVPEKGCCDEDMQRLKEAVSALPGWDNVDRVFITRQGALDHDLIVSLEKVLGRRLTAGTCLTRPFEDLPYERLGYTAPLGMLDYLQQQSRKRRRPASLTGKVFSRAVSFIDRYF